MLKINIGGEEYFDSETEEFVIQHSTSVELEHSLVSLSKWESIFEKPFLKAGEKTTEEVLTYIHCMNLSPEISPEVFSALTDKNLEQINAYIESKQTGTYFSDPPANSRNQETITAELIYFWMITFSIPFECQHWHLNRLITLIKVCNAKNAKPKKMSRNEIAERNRTLNAQRKAELGTKG